MRSRTLALLVLSVAFLTARADDEKKSAPPADELPGKGKVQWQLQGLNDKFTVVKARYTPEARRVTWLIEAKADLAVKAADLGTGLFDEDKVRLLQADLEIEGGIVDPPPVTNLQAAPFLGEPPPVRVQKGERIRVSLELPDEETWDRIRYVVVASKAIPAEKK